MLDMKQDMKQEMNEYRPDKWCLIEVTQEDGSTFHKILGSWHGGYLDGDSWRVNSGVKKVSLNLETHQYEVEGFSSSKYYCGFDSYGYHMTAYGQVKGSEYIKVIESKEEAIKILRDYDV